MERQSTMFSYYDKSPLKAAPSQQTAQQQNRRRPEKVAVVNPSPIGNGNESMKPNQVDVDKVWTENVSREKAIAKDWQSNWSFLGDYDAMGQPLKRRQLGEEDDVALASQSITTSQLIGSSVMSPGGRRIQQLEFQFNAAHRKKPLDKELIGSAP